MHLIQVMVECPQILFNLCKFSLCRFFPKVSLFNPKMRCPVVSVAADISLKGWLLHFTDNELIP